jgi:hypothetical protein
VDLGSVQPLTNAVITWFSSSTRAYQYKIQTNNDDVASDYTDLVNNTGNRTFANTTNALSGTARYVRITVTGVTNAPTGFASFYECQIYGPGLLPAAPTSLVATDGDTVENLT